MKTEVLKKFIKEAVKEAIQEELKEILIEAIKSPTKQKVNESTISLSSTPSSSPSKEPNFNLKEKYEKALGETALSFTTQDLAPLQVYPGMNTLGEGTKLPDGDVPIDMISNLLNIK